MCQLVPAQPDAHYSHLYPLFCIVTPNVLLKTVDISNPECNTMHSFRHALLYFKTGVPGEIVQLFGKWASDCYLRYLRLTHESLLDVAINVSHTVPRF